MGPTCNKNITRSQGSIRCNITPTHWTHKLQRDQHQRIHRHMEMQHSQSTQQHNTDKTPNWTEHKPIIQRTPKSITIHKRTRQHNNNPQTTQSSKPTNKTKSLNILQFNINSIRKQESELEHVLDQHKIDMATIQETKLEKAHKIPEFNNFATLRQDRSHKEEGASSH